MDIYSERKVFLLLGRDIVAANWKEEEPEGSY